MDGWFRLFVLAAAYVQLAACSWGMRISASAVLDTDGHLGARLRLGSSVGLTSPTGAHQGVSPRAIALPVLLGISLIDGTGPTMALDASAGLEHVQFARTGSSAPVAA